MALRCRCANWPPSSYDPETNYFYVCAQDGAAAYSTKEGGAEWEMPKRGGRYFGGDYTVIGPGADPPHDRPPKPDGAPIEIRVIEPFVNPLSDVIEAEVISHG